MLIQLIAKGDVIIVDKVRDELKRGNDELAAWVKRIPSNQIISIVSGDVASSYAKVINYIAESDSYSEAALDVWATEQVADPWIVAVAVSEGAVIVTDEKPKGRIDRNRPSSNPKIPDVAKALGVQVCSLVDMFRALGVTMEFKSASCLLNLGS